MLLKHTQTIKLSGDPNHIITHTWPIDFDEYAGETQFDSFIGEELAQTNHFY